MKIGEFFIDLVVDTASGELTVGNLVTKMGELEVASVGTLGVLIELSEKLASFTDTAIKSSLGLKDYTTLTGDNSMELQKWVRVAEHVQVSGEAVTSTFKSLRESITELHATGQGKLLPLAQRFGLDLSGKDLSPEKILEALRASKEYQQMTNAEKTLWLAKVGIDPLIARELDLVKSQFEGIGTEFSGISEKGQKKFFEMAMLLTDIHHFAQQIIIDIAEWDADPILRTLHSVVDALREMRTLLNEFKKDTAAEFFHYLVEPKNDDMKVPASQLFKTKESAQDMLAPTPYSVPEFKLPEQPSAPAGKKIDITTHVTMNGYQTPEAIKRAAEEAFHHSWNQKFIQNGQVLNAGEVIA